MDLIAPVPTAVFPDRRARNVRRLTANSGFATMLEDVAPVVSMPIRLTAPMVNMAMLLEIMSDAGEPVNDSAPHKTPTATERRANLAYSTPLVSGQAVDTIVTG